MSGLSESIESVDSVNSWSTCFVDTARFYRNKPTPENGPDVELARYCEALSRIDLLLVPIRHVHTLEMQKIPSAVRIANATQKPYLILLSAASRDTDAANARQLLSKFGHVAETSIMERRAYVEAFTSGNNVHDMPDAHSASQELLNLWSEISSVIN